MEQEIIDGNKFNAGDFPAFPMYNELGNVHAEGLSKREYFAGLAMQGILSSSADRGEKYVAEQSVKFADALLSQLNHSTNG